MKVLVTGGAGFVGSTLARALVAHNEGAEVVALDSLVRRGSEFALERLAADGVRFVHGDVRKPEDLAAVGAVDWIVDCSAEPSVQSGYDGGSQSLVDVNLGGTVHCLEHARRHGAGFVLLSTSRIHSIDALRSLPLEEQGTRLGLAPGASGEGWSDEGISADFSTAAPRSLYGTTKLCSERLVEEYAAIFDLPAVIDRCGVIAGPWQMGRVDQGFIALWAARHLYGGSLDYRGFGGQGLQVRDVLHVDDLCDLVLSQVRLGKEPGEGLVCVGGGRERSVSLRELTDACEARAERKLEIGSVPETHPADVPWFVMDNRRATENTGWRPQRSLDQLLDDVFAWLRAERPRLEGFFA